MDIRGLEIVFLLDTSASMNAEDLQPSRLEVAQNLVAAIVDALRTDMVSQVNFAGTAYVQCPLTLDYEAFKLLALASPSARTRSRAPTSPRRSRWACACSANPAPARK